MPGPPPTSVPPSTTGSPPSTTNPGTGGGSGDDFYDDFFDWMLRLGLAENSSKDKGQFINVPFSPAQEQVWGRVNNLLDTMPTANMLGPALQGIAGGVGQVSPGATQAVPGMPGTGGRTFYTPQGPNLEMFKNIIPYWSGGAGGGAGTPQPTGGGMPPVPGAGGGNPVGSDVSPPEKGPGQTLDPTFAENPLGPTALDWIMREFDTDIPDELGNQEPGAIASWLWDKIGGPLRDKLKDVEWGKVFWGMLGAALGLKFGAKGAAAATILKGVFSGSQQGPGDTAPNDDPKKNIPNLNPDPGDWYWGTWGHNVPEPVPSGTVEVGDPVYRPPTGGGN